MNRRHIVGWIVGLSLFHGMASAQGTPNPERAAISSVIATYAEKIQAGDFAAVEALFPARGVHILTGNAAAHGWAEYRDQHLKTELGRFQGARYTHTGIETVVRGNVAWSNFRWQMSGGSGTPEAVLGRGTAVLEKVEGKWLVVHLHFSK